MFRNLRHGQLHLRQDQPSQAVMSNNRYERDAPTAGFAACLRAPQAKR